MKTSKWTSAEQKLEDLDKILLEQWNLQKQLKNSARAARIKWRLKKNKKKKKE